MAVDLWRGVAGRAQQRARARLIVDLWLAQEFASRCRTWCSKPEWIEVWERHGKTWSGIWDRSSPKRAIQRMRGVLGSLGLELRIEAPDGTSMIHVGTRELVEAVEPAIRRARVIDEIATARREGRPENLSFLEDKIDQRSVARDYQDRKKQIGWLAMKHGVGKDRIRRTLAAEKVKIRAERRMRICEKVGPERVARALKIHDEGGSLEDVRRELGLATRKSALVFLQRHARDTRVASERSPPPEPPRSLVAATLLVLARSRLHQGEHGRAEAIRARA